MKSMISKVGYVWVSDRWRKAVVLAQSGLDLGIRCAPDLDPYIVPFDNFISERVFKMALKQRAQASYARKWRSRLTRLARMLTWSGIKLPANRPRQLRMGTLGWARVGRSWQRAVLLHVDTGGVEVRTAPYLRLYRLPLTSFLPEESMEHHLKFLGAMDRMALKLRLRAQGVPYRVVYRSGARRFHGRFDREHRRDDWSAV